jgi:hypothetical protein
LELISAQVDILGANTQKSAIGAQFQKANYWINIHESHVDQTQQEKNWMRWLAGKSRTLAILT